jgi:hypothetical protein
MKFLKGKETLAQKDQICLENGFLKMFDWDAEYASIVKFYAELATKKGWIDYVRDLVREKQQTEPLLKNLGKDVAQKIKELKDENSKQN